MRLVLELRESTDQTVRNANVKVPTGRKWNAQTEFDQAINCSNIKRVSAESFLL